HFLALAGRALRALAVLHPAREDEAQMAVAMMPVICAHGPLLGGDHDHGPEPGPEGMGGRDDLQAAPLVDEGLLHLRLRRNLLPPGPARALAHRGTILTWRPITG